MTDKKTDLRKQAEEIARGKTAQSPENQEAMTPEETRQALHELEVHRIELELQNEELRQAQKELESARARYFDLYDMAPVGYVTLSKKGVILETNLIAAILLGVRKVDLVGRPLSRFIPKEDQDIYYLHRKLLYDTGIPQVSELRMVKKNGTAFWVRLEAAAEPDDDGAAPACRIVIVDITEHRRAEEALHEAHDLLELRVKERTIQLQESEDRLHLAIQAADVGIWEFDVTGNRFTLDATMCRFYGITPDKSSRDYDEVAKMIHPEDLPEVYRAAQQVLLAGSDFNAEFRIVSADGPIRFLKANARIQRDLEGRPLRVIGTNIDITSDKLLVEAAEAASRAKSLFIGNMSHELRTPLSGILGMTDLLLNTPVTEKQRSYAETIRKSGKALLVVVSDILDFSKIEAGNMALKSAPFFVESVIANVMNLFGPPAAEEKIGLHVTMNPELPAVWGDAHRLTQVVSNLVGNAVKFTAAGDIQLTARVLRQTAADVDLEISVRDTGIGMTAEELARLFTPFSQADASTTRRFGGTGLGLAISRHLVELMGGTIRAESIPGKGSVFTVAISLPIAASAQEATTKLDITPISPPPGLDIEAGLKRLDGNRELYLKLLADFVAGHGETPAQLMHELRKDRREEAISLLTAVRGMALNIGGKELEAAAYELARACGTAGNVVPFSIGEPLRLFIDRHEALIAAIGAVLTKQPVVAPARPEGPPGDSAEMHPLLTQLRKALVSEEPRPCKKIMGELLEKRWPEDQETLLIELNRLVQHYRLEEALALLDREFSDTTGRTEKRDNE